MTSSFVEQLKDSQEDGRENFLLDVIQQSLVLTACSIAIISFDDDRNLSQKPKDLVVGDTMDFLINKVDRNEIYEEVYYFTVDQVKDLMPTNVSKEDIVKVVDKMLVVDGLLRGYIEEVYDVIKAKNCTDVKKLKEMFV